MHCFWDLLGLKCFVFSIPLDFILIFFAPLDIEITKKIIPDPAGWFSVAYGTCLSSGISGLFTDDEPTCWSPGGEVLSKYGCHFPQADFGVCIFSFFLTLNLFC